MHRQRRRSTLKCTHTFTLAADLNWARQGLGGRTRQDRKYSSQMERWRGQRAAVTGEKGRNSEKGRLMGGRDVSRERKRTKFI